jgi:hypothetical protein
MNEEPKLKDSFDNLINNNMCMKKIKLLFALVIAWMAGTVSVLADNDNTFYYENESVQLRYQVLSETDKTCSVIAIPQDDPHWTVATGATTIVVPESVTYNGETYSVTELGQYAFAGFTMTSITLPETLKKMGYMSFENCQGLTSVMIPAGVLFDNPSKFYACYNLKDVYVKARDFNVWYSGDSYGNFSASFDNCHNDLTFHVSECIYKQVQYGSKSGFVFGSEYDQNELNEGRIVLDEGWTPQVGDMTVAEVPVVNADGTQVGTRKVFFTITNTNESQREAIIYRPAMGENYDPTTCWKEGGKELYKEAMMPLTNDDVDNGYGTLVLPSKVTVKDNEYTVKGIGAHGFVTNGSVYVNGLGQVTGAYLNGIRIPKGYLQIGVQGLKGLDKLTGDLFIPSSVVQLGDESVADGEVFPTNQGQSFYVKNLYILNNDAEHFNWYQTSSNEFNPNTGQYYYEYRPTLHVSPALLNKFRGDGSSGIGAWCNNYYRYVREFLPLAFKEVDEYDGETIISSYTVYEPGEYEVKFDNFFQSDVTFESSDDDIATIVQDGDYVNIIVGDKTGTATITASAPANEYCDEMTTTLTVIHKGPAELGDQNAAEGWISEDVVAFDGLTKITFGYDDLAVGDYIQSEDDLQRWAATILQGGKIYASAYAEAPYGYIDDEVSEGYYYYCENPAYRLCYNPSELTPNWGAGAWGSDDFDPLPGTNCAGLLAFKVPAGPGTIIVKGYTDSEDAKMAIRLGVADAEPMLIVGGETNGWGGIVSKEFTYSVDPSSPTWVYIYGVSLRPEDGYRGHIESITYIPDGVSLAKLIIMGNPVDEGDSYSDDGITVEWTTDFGGGYPDDPEGGDPEGGDPEGSGALMPIITLDGVTLEATDVPAIEVNSYDEVTIILKGHNTVSTTNTEEGVAAAISFGTMNGMDWEGCSRVIIEAGDEDASLTIPTNSNIGLYNYNSCVGMNGFTGNIAGAEYGIYLNALEQGKDMSFFIDESTTLELSGGEAAFKSENGSGSDINYGYDCLVKWSPESEDYPSCEYNYLLGQFIPCYVDEDNDETNYADAPATYLKFGPPYFIAKTTEGIAMKFVVIDEDEKTCLVYENAIKDDDYDNVTIPETVTYEGDTYTVTEIGGWAFDEDGISTLTIPQTVEWVGRYALGQNIVNVMCYAVEPPVFDSDGYQYSHEGTLYVPVGSKQAYENSDWQYLFSAIEEMSEIVPGDGNADGEGGVDINDAMAVMNHLLGQTPEGFDSEAANVNGDEDGVTITDLVLIIDMILRNNASNAGGE